MQDATLFFVLLFLAVVFISQALLLPAVGSKAKHKQLSERLKETQMSLDEESRTLLREQYLGSLSSTDRSLIKVPIFASIKKLIELSGLSWSLTGTIASAFLLGLGLSITVWILTAQWIITVVVFFTVWVLLYFYLQKKVSDRLHAFEEQLPDALDIMRRMLQAGQPITQAFNEVGEELPDPIGVEFKNTFNLLNYGYDMRLAIMQMAERTPTVSMLAFSSAVLLQKETGGNLSENLDKVSKVLRSRFKLQRKIKTLSAESRLSAWILVLSPFVMFGIMVFMHPGYMDPLYQTASGIKLISIGIVCLFFGSIWIRNIINFEV
ncbi:type II secretion system F family protein [Vibrio maerlii]|uniref:type II secretion system F family protein n=1 Tax=Vibrio maerlii TaxID=2231648 RepID=UPI000E3C3BEC|nr:type II secretion system F family protein [Vibrio maerlii]